MFIKKLLIAAFAISTLGSCQKILDVNPEDQLNLNERFKKLDDYGLSLLGTYSQFRNSNIYGAVDGASNSFGILPDLMAEDFFPTDENLGNELALTNWQYNAGNVQIEAAWASAYNIINQANLTLTGIDKFADKEPGAVNRIKAQALAIRGMVHFHILRYWVKEFDRNSNAPGIPYVTVVDPEAKPARGTVKETYEKIEDDFTTAIDLMQDMDQDINDGDERAFIDEDAVNGMLARMYLYSNEMDKAIEYSTLVINNRPLAPITEFEKIWTDETTDEVLWNVVFEVGQGAPGSHAFMPATNISQYHPSYDLLDLYDFDFDVRGNAYFAVVPNAEGDDRVVLNKYFAKYFSLKRPDGVVNFKVLRTGEMYLIRAEAYARSGTPDEVAAMKDLNDLRKARIAGYLNESLTGQALLDAIDVERRKELAGEGHRFFDLKRKGAADRSIDRANCTGCQLAGDSHRWTWPIPRAEIDANPNANPQNDDYGN